MTTRTKRVVIGGVVVAAIAAAALLLYFLLSVQEDVNEDKALRTASDKIAVSNGAEANQGDGLVHLKVDGTDIDYLLAQATEDLGNDYYLNHDYYGNANRIGCPFVDWRTSLSATHALVYGHGAADSTIIFSQLKNAHEQSIFNGIGNATVTFADGTTRTYAPVMAMSVYEDYETIQNLSFAKGVLPMWLNTLKNDATSVATNAGELIESAKHVLTLVTCTSRQSGQPWRTLVVFVSSE